MRLHIISTTWLTILALASMLVSGFASSSAMMSNTMTGSMQTSSSCQSQIMPSHAGHNMVSNGTPIEQEDCKAVNDMGQECCQMACATVAAILIAPDINIAVNTSLALFTSPSYGDAIHRIQNLDRPPRA